MCLLPCCGKVTGLSQRACCCRWRDLMRLRGPLCTLITSAGTSLNTRSWPCSLPLSEIVPSHHPSMIPYNACTDGDVSRGSFGYHTSVKYLAVVTKLIGASAALDECRLLCRWSATFSRTRRTSLRPTTACRGPCTVPCQERAARAKRHCAGRMALKMACRRPGKA